MAEVFTNKAQTTLNGAINNSTTSIVVTSATGFPTSGDFRILIKAESGNTDEICTVTAVSGTTFTVVRASEGVSGVQTPSSHASGATVAHTLTAQGLISITQQQTASTIQTNYTDYTTANGATTTVADTAIARVGAALMTFSDGNNGGAFIQWYRDGTFNNLLGLAFGEAASWQFRGTTFSAGVTGMSFYLSSNSSGATLNFKNNLGFGRTVRIWEWGTTNNIIDIYTYGKFAQARAKIV